MLSMRLKPALEKRLTRLARQTGRTKTFYATKLIEENIDDLEDRYLAEARLEKRGKSYTSAELRRQLGLEGCVRRECPGRPQETRSRGPTRDSRLLG
jgi:RHH-type transcriptional regulator, rel operon repressor / antitoxin RelB